MSTVKISALPAASSANASAVVPATNAAGTATEKVTLSQIASLANGAISAGDAAVTAAASSDATTKANAAQAYAIQRANHTGSQAISTITGLQTALDGKQASGNYATLVDGRVPSAQLPSFVDDVIEAATLASMPAEGETGKIYVALNSGKIYRWSGTAYVEISPSPGSTDSVAEGSVNLYYTNERAAAAAPVQSVAGRTGTVTLAASDIASGVFATARLGTGSATSATYLRGDGAWVADPRWDLFLPPAPTSVTASAGNAQAAVSWSAPSMPTYAPPLTDYVVQYSSNGGSTWTTFADGTGTTTSATVTGLTNGTAYTFRVSAVNGIGAGAASAASSAVTPVLPNPSLLLHMDGANGSTTFVDSGPHSLVVTANGDAQISTAQSKFGAASGYFDGAGDFIEVTSESLSPGTGDFTAEAWVFASSSSSGYRHIFDTRTSDSTGFSLGFDDQGRVFLFSANAFRVEAGDASTNTWHHVAVARSAGVTRVFLNGTQVGTSWTNSENYSQTKWTIGTYYADNSLYEWNGYIDEVRIVKGTAVYTGNFTPPTAPFANPTPPTPALLLHMNGSNGSTTFTDSSPSALTVTANGGAQISTAQSKFGGASGLFTRASGDRLTIPSGGSAFSFGTGDFTIEAWVRLASMPSGTGSATTPDASSYPNAYWIAGWGVENSVFGLDFYVDETNLAFNLEDYRYPLFGPHGMATGQWYHVAASRSGQTLRLFVDGIVVASGAYAEPAHEPGSEISVGAAEPIGATGGNWDGYIDELRIVKGTAVYTGNFVPPTAPF